MAEATSGWLNLIGQCSNSGANAVGSVSGYFWTHEGRSPEKQHSSDSTPTPTPGFPVASWDVGLQCQSQDRPRCPRLTLGVTFTARSGCWRLLLLRHGPDRTLCDLVEPGFAGRPKPPLPWLDHRAAVLSGRRFA